jgi:zinc transport system substrate-binding protein
MGGQRREISRLSARVGTLIVLLLLGGGCSREEAKPPGEAGRIKVVASIFPLYDFARQVGGDRVEVSLFLPPGTDVHGFEPRPAQLILLERADLFLVTHPLLEPWVEKIVAPLNNRQLQVVDTGRGVSLMPAINDGHRHASRQGTALKGKKRAEIHDVDPHFWLDFANAQQMVENIAQAFAARDPSQAAYFNGRAGEFKARLAALDEKYRLVLAGCRKRMLLSGGHAAFGYVTRRYGLTYQTAYHLSPDAEPTPREMARLARLVKKHGLRYIFHEELIEPRVAQVLAEQTNAGLLLLYAAHNISRDDFEKNIDFLALMEKNLANLELGLACRQP